MTTTYFLAEQVILNLKGGKYQVASSIDIETVIAYMRSILPAVVKGEWFQFSGEGETIPQNLYIVQTDGVPVLKSGKRYYSKLPFMPISLPRNMGIFSVYNPEDPDCEFIPVAAGLKQHVLKNAMISTLFGQNAYSPNFGTVEYFWDPKVATVSMKLIVPDLSSFGDNDPLPIAADHEQMLLQKSFEWFAAQRPPGMIVDPSTDTQFRKQ